MSRPIADMLPPHLTVPLDSSGGHLARLRARAPDLTANLIGQADAFLVVRTRTAIDVGGWLGRRRIRAVALADGLVLMAPGRRPYGERIAFADLGESLYNHVTGEVVLAPAPDARVRRLRLSPLEGYQLLAQIHGKGTDDA